MSKLLEEFQEYLKKMNQYEHVLTLLYWDMKTCTPKLGQEGHVEALTTFPPRSSPCPPPNRWGKC